ncbi:hypothetical protein ACHAQA_002781 [Verticillium albo-atrum]
MYTQDWSRTARRNEGDSAPGEQGERGREDKPQYARDYYQGVVADREGEFGERDGPTSSEARGETSDDQGVQGRLPSGTQAGEGWRAEDGTGGEDTRRLEEEGKEGEEWGKEARTERRRGDVQTAGEGYQDSSRSQEPEPAEASGERRDEISSFGRNETN